MDCEAWKAHLARGMGHSDRRISDRGRGGIAGAGRTSLGVQCRAVGAGAAGGRVHRIQGGAAGTSELRRVDRAAGMPLRGSHTDLGLSATRGGDVAERVHIAGRRGSGRGFHTTIREEKSEVASWKRI